MREFLTGTRLHAVEVGARTVIRRRRYLAQSKRDHPCPPDNDKFAAALDGLRENGYFVVPNFYTAETCAELRAEVDRIVEQQRDIVQLDDTRSDFRIHGVERASKRIQAFHDDNFCRAAGEAYFGAALGILSTLAGRLTAVAGNLGSGQGWHRDASHFQFKALIYLSDVGPENGPFQLVERSHRLWNVFTDTVRGNLVREPRDRINPEQIARVLGPAGKRLRTFVANSGTLILFDSSTIHRGSPIKAGNRYALTNYYYPPAQMTPAMYDHFAPFARPARE